MNRTRNYFGEKIIHNGADEVASTMSYNFQTTGSKSKMPTLRDVATFALENEDVNLKLIVQAAIEKYLDGKKVDSDEVAFPLLGFMVKVKISDKSKFTLIVI